MTRRSNSFGIYICVCFRRHARRQSRIGNARRRPSITAPFLALSIPPSLAHTAHCAPRHRTDTSRERPLVLPASHGHGSLPHKGSASGAPPPPAAVGSCAAKAAEDARILAGRPFKRPSEFDPRGDLRCHRARHDARAQADSTLPARGGMTHRGHPASRKSRYKSSCALVLAARALHSPLPTNPPSVSHPAALAAALTRNQDDIHNASLLVPKTHQVPGTNQTQEVFKPSWLYPLIPASFAVTITFTHCATMCQQIASVSSSRHLLPRARLPSVTVREPAGPVVAYAPSSPSIHTIAHAFAPHSTSSGTWCSPSWTAPPPTANAATCTRRAADSSPASG